MMSIGIRLQTLRKRHQMTQEDLAERLDVTRQVISKWERDQSVPSTDKVIELSRIFGVSTDYVLCIDKETLEEAAEKNLQQMTECFLDSGMTGAEKETEITVSKKGKKSFWLAFVFSALACILAINEVIGSAQAFMKIPMGMVIIIIAGLALLIRVVMLIRKMWSQKIYEFIITYFTFLLSIASVIWMGLLINATLLEAHGYMEWSIWIIEVVLLLGGRTILIVYGIVIVLRFIMKFLKKKKII